MATFTCASKREYQETLAQDRKDQQRQIASVVDKLDVSVFGVLRCIQGVMATPNLSDTEKIKAIEKLLKRSKTEDFDRLRDDLIATAGETGWYNVLESRSLKLQNRLSPVLRALKFMPTTRVKALQKAISHFKADGELSASHVPTDFLDAEQQAALIRDDGTFRISLYKVFLFQAITTAIKSGDLNVEQSYKYRPMDSLPDRQRQVATGQGPPFRAGWPNRIR